MPDTSAILSLPYMLPAQAQKHVTHNEALLRLDILAQLSVAAIGTVTPPAVPTDGETHIPGIGAEGAWAGHEGEIASWDGAGWVFVPARAGWRAFDQGSGVLHVFDGDWQPVRGETQNLDGIGIGTSWDAVNRLAVAADATLLTHAGSGHQVKVNKNTAADTASLLFQTGWSGRAEMGLAGNDDFAIKVSADGGSWVSALAVDGATGHVALGHGAAQAALHAISADTPELRVESDGFGTAMLTAKGRRTGTNTDIAALRFINQEATPGSDSAEAGITAIRKDDPGDIELAFTTCAAGTPVQAFSITPTGSLTALTVFSGGDHLTLNTFATDAARIVGNRGLVLAADADASQTDPRSSIGFETDGVARAVIDAQGHVGIGVAAPVRSLHVADVLRLEPSSTPANPAAGDIYFDATTNKLRCHDGTVWNDLW